MPVAHLPVALLVVLLVSACDGTPVAASGDPRTTLVASLLACTPHR